MRKKWTVRLGMLLAYSLPYAFWGMYGDAVYGTMKGYLPMLVCMIPLCWLALRTRNVPILLAGNALSFLSSYGFVRTCLPALRWSWYFKPFFPLGFLKAVSMAAILAQGFMICLFYVRKRHAAQYKEERL